MFNVINKNAAIITGGLILLGYCKYHFYFSYFDINIYTYISTSELLLSFLPIIVTYFIPIAIIIYLYLIRPPMKYRTPGGKDFSGRVKAGEKKRMPKNLLKHIFFSQLKSKLRSKLILCLITHPLFIAICLLLWATILFWYHVNVSQSFEEVEPLFYMVSIGWLLFIIEPIAFEAAFEAYKGISILNFIGIVKTINYFFILTYFIYFSQKIEALKKMHGLTIEKVQVQLNNGEILATDSSLLYIGQTTNYIFFHNKKDSTNMIFNNSNIYKLVKTSKLKQK